MKSLKLFLALALMALLPMQAFAGRAAHFKGWYEILVQGNQPLTKQYFLLDNDTLGVIWAKYAEGPLPADLEKYREEPTILAGFTNRSMIYFGLERGALIADNYLAMPGGEGEKLELRRRPDGTFDMITIEVRPEGTLRTLYHLAAPRETPESN